MGDWEGLSLCYSVLGLETLVAMSGFVGVLEILILLHQALYQLSHHPSLFWLAPALLTSGFSGMGAA